MGYKFKCNSCNYDWDVPYMGIYPVSFITNAPCPKCDVKSVEAIPLESPPDDTNKAPPVHYVTSKKPSTDFRNFVSQIKKAHKGSTIEEKW